MKNKIYISIIIFISLFVILYHVDKENEKAEIILPTINSERLEYIENYHPIVYKGMTKQELIKKINRVLKNELKDKANIIVDLSLKYNVDPYMGLAIILHETGCNAYCSYIMKNYHNVGGMRSNGNYFRFNNLEEGLEKFYSNLKYSYISRGYDSPEKINPIYAGNPNWYKKIKYYMGMIEKA